MKNNICSKLSIMGALKKNEIIKFVAQKNKQNIHMKLEAPKWITERKNNETDK